MIVKNRAYGIIKNKKASYCFISEQVPKDKRKHYFAHAKEFKAGQFKALEAGQVVSFEPELSGRRGPAAKNIKLEGE